MPEFKCAMEKDCGVLGAVQKSADSLRWIDLIRELTRNFIGLGATFGILYMLYDFVRMTPPDDRMNIMLLVIGYLGGLATGISTWYFGAAMKSAVQTALEQAKVAAPPPPENPILPSPQTDKKPDSTKTAVG